MREGTMTKKEIDRSVADLAYWQELGDALGWELYGFTFRASASFRSGENWETVQLSGRQRDDIISAINGGLRAQVKKR